MVSLRWEVDERMLYDELRPILMALNHLEDDYFAIPIFNWIEANFKNYSILTKKVEKEFIRSKKTARISLVTQKNIFIKSGFSRFHNVIAEL